VLHPKQEDAPPIHIPPPPVTQPLKPEVYFIKYKNREEAHGGGGGDYGTEHGGGGVGGILPSPGEEFGGGGGGGDSSGYVHRRYGRGDLQTSTPPSSATASITDTDVTTTGEATSTEHFDDGDGMTPEQREMVEAETTSAATSAFTSTAVDLNPETSSENVDELMLRGGYSTEYNDASVDSTNLSETHVQLSTTAPKGKNGH